MAFKMALKSLVRIHATVAAIPAVDPPQPSFIVALNQAWVLFGGAGLKKDVAVPDSSMKALMRGVLVQAKL